jgi:hypothetical protein
MSDDVKALTVEDTEDCPFCEMSKVEKCTTSFANVTGGSSKMKPRRGTYGECRYCGVTFVTGDYRFMSDGKRYLLHSYRGVGCDQLSGDLVTGPWGTALVRGERPGDRVVLRSDDIPSDTGADPLEHIEEIKAAVRARQQS